MKYLNCLALFFFFTCSFYLHSSSLDTNDRSPELTQQIEKQFQEAKIAPYKFFGETAHDYGLGFFVYTYDLAYALIKSAQGNQKVFNIIDIGSGKGGWGDGLASYLNEQSDLNNDITINIIGLTAQNDVPYEKETVGKCTKYLIGNFNVEFFNQNLHILKAKGLDVENKIDFAFSKYTFMHLADPLGTLIEIFNNLRPGTGILFFDTFFLNISMGKNQFEATHINQILPLTNAQFLIPSVPDGLVFQELYFLMRRSDTKKIAIPFIYGPLKSFSASRMSGDWPKASYILREGTKLKPLKEQYIHPTHKSKEAEIQVLGSSDSDSLYDWLVTNIKDLGSRTSKWQSAFAEDLRVKTHNPSN
jgi:SAM-dependent methyltransferase